MITFSEVEFEMIGSEKQSYTKDEVVDLLKKYNFIDKNKESSKLESTTKRYYYNFSDPMIQKFCIMDDSANGISNILIRWSHDRNGDNTVIDYYQIDSLNPLRVLSGVVCLAEFIIHTIQNPIHEVQDFVEALTIEDIKKFMESSTFLSYHDRDQVCVPPGGEIKLWKPSKEDLEFQAKALSVFKDKV